MTYFKLFFTTLLALSSFSCMLNLSGTAKLADGTAPDLEGSDSAETDVPPEFDVPEITCPEGLVDCDGECVSLDTDRNNCGSCGRTCPPDRVCEGGDCTCPEPLTDCGGVCVNLMNSNDHCGSCNNRCDPPSLCNGSGVCDVDCAPGFTRCEGTDRTYCADTSTDPLNCGSCGHACSNYDNAAAVCNDGNCEMQCLPGYHDLNGIADDGCEYHCAVTSDTESCNGYDDNCNGIIDETFNCELGVVATCTSTCGTEGMKICNLSCEWDPCIPPSEECNGIDDDCNGTPDDIFECRQGADVECTTTCGTPGTGVCSDTCRMPSPADCHQYPDWWNGNFIYRRNITVSDTGTSGVPADYTASIFLGPAEFSGKIRSDGEDVRIVHYDGTWSEKTRHAARDPWLRGTIRFMVAGAISPGGSDESLWLYYGNPSATLAPSGWSNSMGADGHSPVYLAADDFEEHSAGDCPDGWSPCAGVFAIEEDSDNRFLVSTGDNQYLFAGDPAWTDIWVEIFIHSDSWDSGCPGIASRASDLQNLVYAGYNCGNPPPAIHSAQAWTKTGGGGYNLIIWDNIADPGTTWHLIGMRWLGNTLILYHDRNVVGEDTVADPALTSGMVGMFSSYGSGNRIDTVMVRRAMDPEPSVTLSPEEQYCP